jgi:hypothetical protein
MISAAKAQDLLPSDLPNHPRLSDQNRDQVTESAQSDQKVQSPRRGRSKDSREEKAGGDLTIRCDQILGY